MNDKFPQRIVDEARNRQQGDCAKCGEQWGVDIMGEGVNWFVHPLVPFHKGGEKTYGNCVILCGKAWNNCHLLIGHRGDEKAVSAEISRENLPYFYGNPANHPEKFERRPPRPIF